MLKPNYAISNFDAIIPPYHSTQEELFKWLIAAHVKAESKNLKDTTSFEKEISEKLHYVGAKPGIIHKRYHAISDFSHRNWNEMSIYRLEENPQGLGLQVRQSVHKEIVKNVFEKFYENDTIPEHLVHVTCTGYTFPNAAQEIISKNNLKKYVSLIHLYHMGCYASIPALQVASGLIHGSKTSAHIIHTEICSLHINPLRHEADQLVGQSLFADGFIKYSLALETGFEKPYLKIIDQLEQIIPQSLDMMSWTITDSSFLFFLSKEVPVHVVNHVESFVNALCEKSHLDPKKASAEAIFAIHPGGPKILDYVKKILNLQEHQVQTSRFILKEHGNISSATLPHIWQNILNDSQIPSGSKIITLAFGPGLTIAGAVLEKRV